MPCVQHIFIAIFLEIEIITSMYPVDFEARIEIAKHNHKIGSNCIGAALYLLDCIETEKYIDPHSSKILEYLTFVGELSALENIQIPENAEAIGVWRKDQKYYHHMAVLSNHPHDGHTWERSSYNKDLTPSDVKHILGNNIEFFGTLYELHFLAKKVA